VPVLAAPGTMYRAAIGISHLHCLICQTAAANCSKVRDVYNEALFYGVMIADVVEGL
jgi:phosphoribosyl-dephospho-CoA transferase